LRSPRLAAHRDGARLWVIAWEEGGERLLEHPLTADGTPGVPELGPQYDAIATLAPGTPPEPSDDPADEERAVSGDWTVTIRRDGYRSSVVAYTPQAGVVRMVPLWLGWGTAAAPAIVAVEDGAWIAFHHNVREDTGEPDIAKWIAVRFVDRDGNVFEPASEMTDRDRDREGEEQSFELPSLAVGEDGAVALFGRGSHSFWRQDLGAAGFAPRVALGAGSSWGCRGRRVAVVVLRDGALLTARRERGGIEIERMEPPRGGRPALVPARAQLDNEPVPRARASTRRSDPAARDGRTTLFGDVHQHSAHSDGIGVADEPYLRARYVYGDDFCALTDHESFLGKRIGPGEWAYLQSVAERHDAPGQFATNVAYEWTGRMHPGPGHKVVYLPGTGRPIVSRDDVPEGKDAVAAVKALGGFAVPHHVGWTGADEAGHDPEGQPVWEICSCHGCYESFAHELGQRGDLRDQMVDAVLRRGLRFGFIACSDGHGLLWHHGVARKRDPFRTGLTAVQARERTRAAILEAIRERRCYATSGTPILLDLRAGDAPMGSELRIDGPVRVTATAHGTAPITRLELVGPAGPIAAAAGEGDRARLEADASAPFVYARVRQADGEMAWSSPIFWS
jgi:hypothetical protein